jgi:hypothetical protein
MFFGKADTSQQSLYKKTESVLNMIPLIHSPRDASAGNETMALEAIQVQPTTRVWTLEEIFLLESAVTH